MEAFEQLIEQIAPNLYAYRDRFFTSFAATFEMFAKAGIIAFVVGLFFGVLLVITRKGGVRQNLVVYQIVNIVINVFRSIPFIILLIFLIPLTRAVVGSAIGVKGAILPLVFGTVPFYTRQVEVALTGVNEGKVEAARSMASGSFRVLSPALAAMLFGFLFAFLFRFYHFRKKRAMRTFSQEITFPARHRHVSAWLQQRCHSRGLGR